MGKSIIFSAPSGAGKTTIVHAMLRKFPVLKFSVSATNRTMREGETQGKDYHFMSTPDFLEAIKAGRFLEYEEVYAGNFYGTLHTEVASIWSAGRVAIFDVDVVGGLRLKEKLGKDALAVFVKAPSLEVIEKRLRERQTESEEKIATRIAKASSEMQFAPSFDKILLNENLSQALDEAALMIADFLLSQEM